MQIPWNPEVFLLTNEREAKRRNVREPWAHTLGPLNEREEKRQNAREPLGAHASVR